MADIEKTMENLKKRGFDTTYFLSGKEAADYIVSQLKGEDIGFGGSVTIDTLGLLERLAENNNVYRLHYKDESEEAQKKLDTAEVYMTSANAIAQTGEIINIDGFGNRVSSTLYGRKKVYIIVGINKIEEDFGKALWRARNIASPLNARRLNKNTPCAKGEMKCHDCQSPDRICRGLVVLWNKLRSIEKMEVIIINEELGY